MFPTHTSRRARPAATQEFQQPPPSWDHTASPPYSTNYPGHTVPGYAYPSKYGGNSNDVQQGFHSSASSASSSASTSLVYERPPTQYPQWNPTKMQRGYERELGQDGNYLDGSQHSYRASSEGDPDSQHLPENPPTPAESFQPSVQSHQQRDPVSKYQQYQYQAPVSDLPNDQIPQQQQSGQAYTQSSREISSRYYQTAPADYQPYIPERVPRTQQNNHLYNKWTPPPRLQQHMSPDIHQPVQVHQEPTYYEPAAEPSHIVEQDYDSDSHRNGVQHHHQPPPQQQLQQSDIPPVQNGGSTQKYYPGHPAYKWTPPVVLQVFQEPPPQVQVESKYASHNHNEINNTMADLSVRAVPHVLPTQHLPTPSSSQVDQEFVDWAKLQPSQNVIARLTQENIQGHLIRNSLGNSLLHSACEVGNLSLIYSLLDMYDAHNFATFNSDGMHPLHVACKYNMKFIIMFFIKNKIVSGMELTSDGSSPLHIAVQFNAFDVVDYLLTILPSHSLWTFNNKGLSPIHIAAIVGSLQMLQKLSIVAGPEISRVDGVEGRTCLHWAAVHHRYDIIKYLIQEKKVNIHQADKNGQTADQIHNDVLIHYLIFGTFPQSHSEQHQQQQQQQHHRHYQEQEHENEHEDHTHEVSSTSSHHPPNSPSSSYIPPSNPSYLPPKSSQISQTEEAKLAASRERSLNKMKSKETVEIPGKRWDCHGFTAPPSEVPIDETEIVKCSTSVVDKPTHVGKLNVKNNWIKNTDDDDENKQHKTENDSIETIASSKTNESVVLTPQNILHLFDWVAVDNKITELENSLGVTPDIRVDVNEIKHPETGESLLHVACKKGHLAVAQFLVEGVGSNVNCVDLSGSTPLHEAVKGLNVLIVRYLVKYCGALLDISNKDGQTPLDISNGLESTDDREEITRILSKAVGKGPEKRTKITLPIFQKK